MSKRHISPLKGAQGRPRTPTGDVVVEVTRLRKSFRSFSAVRDASFSVRQGEIFGILGPNGAGKTTIVECIAGALHPTDGTVTVLGVEPAKDRTVVRERVGYQMQSSSLPSAIRVQEALNLFAAFYAQPADVTEMLRIVGLEAERKRPYSKLSGGQKQRLSIALALIGSPELVILDEVTTGLDPQGRRDAWHLVETIRSSGVTVLLVSHYLDEIERLCDRIAIIAQGETRFQGTPAGLLEASPHSESPCTLEDAYLALLAREIPNE